MGQVAQLDDPDVEVRRRRRRPRSTVAADSRSASRRVDDGWLSPAETTTRVRCFMPAPVLLACSAAALGGEQRGVGGRVGHVGRLERGELLAQHRDDLLAEQVELLQDGLQRQAGVVQQEQLALVVADVVAEAEGTVDDLLRAADGQRRLPGEVLQRRAVAVDRGVVEVRPELA